MKKVLIIVLAVIFCRFSLFIIDNREVVDTKSSSVVTISFVEDVYRRGGVSPPAI